MTRYIDADAIEYTHTIARSLDDGHNWNELVVTADEIADMPTLELIHCKDCQYFNGEYKLCNVYLNFTLEKDEKDFCSFAELKESD